MGDHPLISKFLKGVQQTRPSLPRYSVTSDSDIVVRYLKGLSVDSLKNLTLKVTMLMALITAQRAQTLLALKLSNMMLTNSEITVHISVQLKTQPEGSELRFEKFSDADLCIVSLMCKYIKETRGLQVDNQLHISFVRPHASVS